MKSTQYVDPNNAESAKLHVERGQEVRLKKWQQKREHNFWGGSLSMIFEECPPPLLTGLDCFLIASLSWKKPVIQGHQLELARPFYSTHYLVKPNQSFTFIYFVIIIIF